MEVKRTTADVEAEMDKNVLLFLLLATLSLSSFPNWSFKNLLKRQELYDSFHASINRNPNLLPVYKFNYLKAEQEEMQMQLTLQWN